MFRLLLGQHCLIASKMIFDNQLYVNALTIFFSFLSMSIKSSKGKNNPKFHVNVVYLINILFSLKIYNF